jgi:hypothetical protein
LVPLDESEAAEVALQDALMLARSVGADITLLEVVQPLGEVIKTKHRDVCIDLLWPGRVRRAASYLLSVTERPMWKNVPVRAAVEMGEITESITNYVRSHSIDFVVWPPTPLGKTPLCPTILRDSPTPLQSPSAGLPSRPSRGGFEHCLIHNEMTEPWILEDSTEKLQTPYTGG